MVRPARVTLAALLLPGMVSVSSYTDFPTHPALVMPTSSRHCSTCHTELHSAGTISRAALDAALSVERAPSSNPVNNWVAADEGTRNPAVFLDVAAWAPGRDGFWRDGVAQAARDTSGGILNAVNVRAAFICDYNDAACQANTALVAGNLYDGIETNACPSCLAGPPGFPTVQGSALYIRQKTVNITSCAFVGNKLCNRLESIDTTVCSGGAVFITGLESKVHIVETTFAANTVQSTAAPTARVDQEFGGALAALDKASLFIVRCAFVANEAGSSGGALHLDNSIAQIEMSIFVANHAVHHALARIATAGAIMAVGGSRSVGVSLNLAELSLEGTLFIENFAVGDRADELWVDAVAKIYVKQTFFYPPPTGQVTHMPPTHWKCALL